MTVERKREARVSQATHPPSEPDSVRTNVTLWLRMFRPAFQRQFASLPEADIELIDLLRAADQRREKAGGPQPGKPAQPRPGRDPNKNGHTAG